MQEKALATTKNQQKATKPTKTNQKVRKTTKRPKYQRKTRKITGGKSKPTSTSTSTVKTTIATTKTTTSTTEHPKSYQNNTQKPSKTKKTHLLCSTEAKMGAMEVPVSPSGWGAAPHIGYQFCFQNDQSYSAKSRFLVVLGL